MSHAAFHTAVELGDGASCVLSGLIGNNLINMGNYGQPENDQGYRG